jgi:2-hydroxychromene-2-carboxylate isomerase
MPASTPVRQPLNFYFDFISPFGYFASLRIDELANRHGRTVQWHPMLLGVSVMKVMGLKPLLDTPLKGPYTRRDVQRYARLHGIHLGRDFDAPPTHPLTMARAFCWAAKYHPGASVALAKAMLHAYWIFGADLSAPESLGHIALPSAIRADEVIAAVQSEEAARLLRAEVRTSLAAGIFGSPTVVVDGEPFWGIDKFSEIEHWLATGGW